MPGEQGGGGNGAGEHDLLHDVELWGRKRGEDEGGGGGRSYAYVSVRGGAAFGFSVRHTVECMFNNVIRC